MSKAVDWLLTPISKVQEWYSDYGKWNAFVRELEDAGEDGARILQELRLNGGDIRRLMAAREDAHFRRMLAALGVTVERSSASCSQ